MFKGLSEYLADLCRSDDIQQTSANRKSEYDLEDVAGSVALASFSTQQRKSRVDLISLFIDLAGYVREKSQFTQFLNYCYAVDKESKRVVLEILPV